MIEINRMLYKALDPLLVTPELNLIASKHIYIGNRVQRGKNGMVKVLFPNGEVHYTPSERGIEIRILKYEEHNCCGFHSN